MLATAVYFGMFGEIDLQPVPGNCGDTFGAKYATTNSGMLYTAKGTASLLVPLASIVAASYGWQAVFVIVVALNATAALMALFVIKPMRPGAPSSWAMNPRPRKQPQAAVPRPMPRPVRRLPHTRSPVPRQTRFTSPACGGGRIASNDAIRVGALSTR